MSLCGRPFLFRFSCIIMLLECGSCIGYNNIANTYKQAKHTNWLVNNEIQKTHRKNILKMTCDSHDYLKSFTRLHKYGVHILLGTPRFSQSKLGNRKPSKMSIKIIIIIVVIISTKKFKFTLIMYCFSSKNTCDKWPKRKVKMLRCLLYRSRLAAVQSITSCCTKTVLIRASTRADRCNELCYMWRI